MILQGRKAIVTGATKGMGATITTTLAKAGADIMLTARDTAALDPVAAEVRTAGREAQVCACDITDEVQVEAIVAAAKTALGGRLDIVVNVAGGTGPIETPVWNIPGDGFRDVLVTNVVGTFLPMKHVLPTMIEQHYGKVMNIGGTSSLCGYRYRTGYSSSKWCLRGLTRTAMIDAGEFNVNVVCPGIVETPRRRKLVTEKARVRSWFEEEVDKKDIDEMALRRVTVPQDIAEAVLFLSSDLSQNITCQEITVGGGWDV